MTAAPAILRKNGHMYTRCPVDGCENYKDYQAATCRKHCNQAGANNHHAGHYKTGHLMTNYERKTAYYSRNPEIKRAHTAVYRAVKAGKLVKPDRCYICGSVTERLEAHHHNGYDRAHWLDVVWPCYACHRELHMREGKDMATGQMVNNFYNAWKERHALDLPVAEDDGIIRQRDALNYLRRMVCRDDFHAIFDRIMVKWEAISGEAGYMAPHGWFADQINLHIKSITARMTSEATRRMNQEYAEPDPVNPNYCQG